ncbi:hypothetical protein [Exiguobacterium sp. JLM-2]|uniref:hypothetical protein n=1 Tax=Exiguobacterium sp. JLM-2 TaxID=1647415 RepID=UPI00069BB2C3|nr:hypothetical protein [Exiguobacterium sp. JLM-2]
MNPNSRGAQIAEELLNNFPLSSNASPSEFLNFYWNKYVDNYGSNNSLNGTVFENFVILALAREGIDNIYHQTELTYVPSAIFDVFLYNPEKPIALSIKTSLRERWKQADLEALAIKQVHKDADCFVLTLSDSEVLTRRSRSTNYAGLDGFILANTNEFDDFVNYLRSMQFDIAGFSPIIKESRNCYTANELRNQFNL